MEDITNPNSQQQAPEDLENQSAAPKNLLNQPAAGGPEALLTIQENTAVPPVEDEEDGDTPPHRSNKWLLIGGLLVIFLAAAVFFGARLVKPQNASAAFDKGGMLLTSKGGPSGAKSVRVDMTPAKELPQQRPNASGLFVRREDQSIFIGTGNIRMTAKKSSNSSSQPEVSGSYDGPVVEVVINHETKVYQDTTEMPEPDTAKNGTVTAQQTVKPGSLDDLSTNSMVTVWGDKQGDRYIAKVIVFR